MDSLLQYSASSDEEQEMDTEEGPVVFTESMPSNRSTTVTTNEMDDAATAEDMTHSDNSLGDTDYASATDVRLTLHLPQPKAMRNSANSSDNDDLSVIPPKKIYGDEEKPSAFGPLTSYKKTGTGKVQISIPSLKDFADDGEDSQKRKTFQGSQKASGLFALLPEPKNEFSSFRLGKSETKTESHLSAKSESAVLHAVSNKTPTAHLIPQSVKNASLGKRPAPLDERLEKIKTKYLKQEFNVQVVSKSSAKLKPKPNEEEGDSEDEEPSSSDFFSLDVNSRMQFEVSQPEPSSNAHTHHQPDTAYNFHPAVEDYSDSLIELEEPTPEPLPRTVFPDRVQPQQPDLMKYIQPTKKGKGKAAEVNMIDVNADDLRPQTTDWLKTITDTSIIPPRKAVLPGGMTKRKHQITYLAAEAKAREEELQNQWASNRQARRQTQNKYGF